MEALSSQLYGYLAVLKGKLVEVINEDYNDFVSLSTKLVNVDGAVAQMQKPLLVLKVMLQHADDVHTLPACICSDARYLKASCPCAGR